MGKENQKLLPAVTASHIGGGRALGNPRILQQQPSPFFLLTKKSITQGETK
jgi:hypothetical protein